MTEGWTVMSDGGRLEVCVSTLLHHAALQALEKEGHDDSQTVVSGAHDLEQQCPPGPTIRSPCPGIAQISNLGEKSSYSLGRGAHVGLVEVDRGRRSVKRHF
jgi:hypothetical protein